VAVTAKGDLARGDHGSRPWRVASWPGRSFATNPVIGLLCEAIEAAGAEVVDLVDPRTAPSGRFDILHMHWPEQVFWWGGGALRMAARMTATLHALARWKAAGTRLVWTVHNLVPHELGSWKRALWTIYVLRLGALVDGFLTLCPSTVGTVRQNIPALRHKPADFAWHPAYPGVERSVAVRKATREALGIPEDARVVAFVGLVRPHKGVSELISAFRQLPYDNLSLLIAGQPLSDDDKEAVVRSAGGDSRIQLALRFLDIEDLCAFTGAADIIAAPFRSYLHSGSLILALSAARPVLTPEADFSTDLRAEVGIEWVHLYKPPLTSEILLRAIMAEPPVGHPTLCALEPASSGRKILSFYQELLADR
jgi:beta-1,4-mannosyltransferase